MSVQRDENGNVQYVCPKCEIGTVTQYEHGSTCDTCPWTIYYE